MKLKNCDKKSLLTIILFLAVYLFFIIFKIVTPDQDYSMSERRALKKNPAVKMEELLSGNYMEKFDDYTLDQFPLRDSLRSVKAYMTKNILFQKDNHGLYYKNNHLSKIEYPANMEKLERAYNKLTQIYDEYISKSNCKTYLSVIPDKNNFLAEKNYLSLNYDAVINDTKNALDFASYIDIASMLSLDDFYFTDQHWKQECIIDIAKKIADAMNTEFKQNFIVNELDGWFYGTYYGQSALKVRPDKIKYLTNESMKDCTVTSYNTGKPQPVAIYDMKKAVGRDSYEMFLNGSDAVLEIENPNSLTNKELVVFRDSFGSSLVPLLMQSYGKITLIDLRYIQSSMIKNFVEFNNQDVLFLYSTLVLNSAF